MLRKVKFDELIFDYPLGIIWNSQQKKKASFQIPRPQINNNNNNITIQPLKKNITDSRIQTAHSLL